MSTQPTSTDEANRSKALREVFEGKTITEVATKYSISPKSLHNWIRDEITTLEDLAPAPPKRERLANGDLPPLSDTLMLPAVSDNDGWGPDDSDRVPSGNTVLKFRCEHCNQKLKTSGIRNRMLTCRRCQKKITAPTHADDPRVYYYEESAV